MKNIKIIILLFVVSFFSQKGFSQQVFMGQIKVFAGNFAPAGWMFCDGSLLPISEYEALFTILGTTYGGDGQSTFALPDFRGRIVTGANNSTGLGLSNVQLGQLYGSETNTMNINQMPMHNHGIACVSTAGTSNLPTGNLFANAGVLDKEFANTASNTTMKATMVNPSNGGNQPFNNMQPTTGLNYIIALYGVYPTQN